MIVLTTLTKVSVHLLLLWQFRLGCSHGYINRFFSINFILHNFLSLLIGY